MKVHAAFALVVSAAVLVAGGPAGAEGPKFKPLSGPVVGPVSGGLENGGTSQVKRVEATVELTNLDVVKGSSPDCMEKPRPVSTPNGLMEPVRGSYEIDWACRGLGMGPYPVPMDFVDLKTFIRNGFRLERVTYEDVTPFPKGSLPPPTTSTRQYGSINGRSMVNGVNSLGANIVAKWDSIFVKTNLLVFRTRDHWQGEGHYILHVFVTGPRGIDPGTGKPPVRPN